MRCIFCGKELNRGTGVMLIRNDAKIVYFCGTKCEKNMNKLGRIPRTTRWTEDYQKEKKSKR